jgi:cytochrome c553
MPQAVRLLRVLLALVLCLQSGLAAAQCLRLAAAPAHKAFHVEICTSEGIVLMDLGGTSDQDAPSGHDHAGFCLACHGLPQTVLPEPASVPLPVSRPVAAPRAASKATPPVGARAAPYAPRAPPAFS